MKTKTAPARFLILIPHRDAEKPLWRYRRALFAMGLEGAYSFPQAAPLALLSRPLSLGELKSLAPGLRTASLEGGRGGWFRAGEPAAEPLPPSALFGEGLGLYGPLLDLPRLSPRDFPADALLHGFSRMVLAGAVIRDLPENLPAAPSTAFRAAALANLAYRPLLQGGRDFSFEWKIGRPVWLPGLGAGLGTGERGTGNGGR